MNSVAENRRRVALAQADRQRAGIAPGIDGLEVAYLRKLRGPISYGGDRAEYSGGWKATKFKVGAGQ